MVRNESNHLVVEASSPGVTRAIECVETRVDCAGGVSDVMEPGSAHQVLIRDLQRRQDRFHLRSDTGHVLVPLRQILAQQLPRQPCGALRGGHPIRLRNP